MVEFVDNSSSALSPQTAPAAGPTDDKTPLAPLTQAINIPGYTILNKLGEGEMAAVWKAEQQSLKRLVAIKILKPEFCRDEEKAAHFIDEAKSVAKLKSRHIIQIYDAGKFEESHYLVTEYVEGRTVGELLKGGGTIDQKKALAIAAAVAEGLDEAWSSEGLHHGNLKPDNIMLDRDGDIKIADLGLSGVVALQGDRPDRKNAELPHYMAPEQARGGKDIDFRANMYSLGATLYQMVTGKIPFAGLDHSAVLQAQAKDQIPDPREINADITPGCAQIITKLMMKEPRYRHRRWETAARDLTKLSNGKLVVSKIPPAAQSTIAKPGGAPQLKGGAKAPARKPAVASRQSQQRQEDLKKKYSRNRAPLWLKIPLELAMAAWFCVLASQLIWKPIRPERPQRTRPRPPAFTAEPQPLQPRPSVPRPAPSSPGPRPYTPPTQPDFSGTPDLPTQPMAPAVPEPAQEEPVPPGVVRDVVRTLLKEDPVSARATLAMAPLGSEHASSKESISAILNSGRLGDTAVADAFKQAVGKERYIMMRGQRRTIVVTSVAANTISADMFIGSSSSGVKRPIQFKVSQLDPAEQSRWLGAVDAPETALAKFVLHMKAGDFLNARKLAEHCGPLTDACIAESDSRIQMLTP
jgi:serine/threonine protein kinase